MFISVSRFEWVLLIVALKSASGCDCLVSRSACQEFNASNLVFVGTVESIAPATLNNWKTNRTGREGFDALLNAAIKASSPSELKVLQERAFALLVDLPTPERKRLMMADSLGALRTELNWIKSQGTLVRFKVRTLYRHKDDDDDQGDRPSQPDVKRKDGEHMDYAEVWNERGDCGFPFEAGETYLVYANDDEETNRLGTSICRRTVRVSDAGEDLSYLYFEQNGGAQSLRLEGFVTSDFRQLKLDRFHYVDAVKSPIENVTVELKIGTQSRHTVSNSGGSFVFDGLSEGDYLVSVFAAGLSDPTKLLSGPTRIHVEDGKCSMLPILVLTSEPEH